MSDLDEGLGHMEPQMPPPPAQQPEVDMEVREVEDDPMDEEPEPLPPREQIPDEEVFKDAPTVKKVKRKCSEKQLAHLAKCREKARAKKEADRKFNEKQIEKQRKMLLAEERVKAEKAEIAREKRNLAKAKRQVRQPLPPDPQVYEEEDFPYEEPPQQNTYRGQEHPQVFHKLTASEIRAIQHDAINDYEILRKERKHKKKMEEEQRKIEHERRKVMGMMSGKPTPDHHDPWSSAFNF